MFEIGLSHYMTVSATLFTLGILGIFLNRKNVIIIMMSVELMLLAVNINLVAFSADLGDMVGQVFTMFVLTVAAAEAGEGGAEELVTAMRRIDKASAKGVIHANAAARQKSRLQKRINALDA